MRSKITEREREKARRAKAERAAVPHGLENERNLIAQGYGSDVVHKILRRRRGVTCNDCGFYPCFRGIENISCNLALTCQSFNYIKTSQ